MLPSRGLSRTNPASLLRSRLSTASSRHFSSRHNGSVLATRLSLTNTAPTPLVASSIATASVFASRHGATRNLSLWGWGWGSKKPAQDSATTTAIPETQPTIVEAAQDKASAAAAPHPSQPTPAPLESAAAAPVEQDLFSSAPPSLDDFDAAAIWNLKEDIGYLKDLGLDYGWGPTAMAEWTLEHIYIFTGMPWWASIAAVAVAFRAIMFWPTIVSTRHSARLQAVQKEPAHVKAYEEMQLAARNGDKLAMMTARGEMSKIKKSAGAQMRWVAVPFLTIPFSYGMFRLMRGMAAIPVPTMETGGLLWFTDLSVADPYYILPMANAILGIAMFKATSKNNINPTPMQASMNQMMTYALPPLVFVTTAWLPAAVQWFFLCLTTSSVFQSGVTLSPAFRRFADLPALPEKQVVVNSARTAAQGWQAPMVPRKQSWADGMKSNMKDMKTGIDKALGSDEKSVEWKKAQEYEDRRAAEEKRRAELRLEEQRMRRAQKNRR